MPNKTGGASDRDPDRRSSDTSASTGGNETRDRTRYYLKMMFFLAIYIGKIILKISRLFNLGAGSTWPGHIALKIYPSLLTRQSSQIKNGIVFVCGTNGKTTTAKIISEILGQENIVRNESGANLLNGLASALIEKTDLQGNLSAQWGIFETDENTLLPAVEKISPQVIILLNLFRDQLDRYGEVNIIADRWEKALSKLSSSTTLILNADDPRIVAIGSSVSLPKKYFGVEDEKLTIKKLEHAVDSHYCPRCGTPLKYSVVFFSHLGHWQCPVCYLKRPSVDLSRWPVHLPGIYNLYNFLAAVLATQVLSISNKKIISATNNFQPAFGRQEEFIFDDKKIKIFLCKNPAGFNASLRTVLELNPKVILFALNDRIPDGRDVSWIWDVDLEMIPQNIFLIATGDRAYDMGLRLKYAITKIQNSKFKIQNYDLTLKVLPNSKQAINKGLEMISENETLYVLPTYSAMLEIRKILGGKKIL